MHASRSRSVKARSEPAVEGVPDTRREGTVSTRAHDVVTTSGTMATSTTAVGALELAHGRKRRRASACVASNRSGVDEPAHLPLDIHLFSATDPRSLPSSSNVAETVSTVGPTSEPSVAWPSPRPPPLQSTISAPTSPREVVKDGKHEVTQQLAQKLQQHNDGNVESGYASDSSALTPLPSEMGSDSGNPRAGSEAPLDTAMVIDQDVFVSSAEAVKLRRRKAAPVVKAPVPNQTEQEVVRTRRERRRKKTTAGLEVSGEVTGSEVAPAVRTSNRRATSKRRETAKQDGEDMSTVQRGGTSSMKLRVIQPRQLNPAAGPPQQLKTSGQSKATRRRQRKRSQSRSASAAVTEQRVPVRRRKGAAGDDSPEWSGTRPSSQASKSKKRRVSKGARVATVGHKQPSPSINGKKSRSRGFGNVNAALLSLLGRDPGLASGSTSAPARTRRQDGQKRSAPTDSSAQTAKRPRREKDDNGARVATAERDTTTPSLKLTRKPPPPRSKKPLLGNAIRSSTFAAVLRIVASLPKPKPKSQAARVSAPSQRPPVWADVRSKR